MSLHNAAQLVDGFLFKISDIIDSIDLNKVNVESGMKKSPWKNILLVRSERSHGGRAAEN